MGGVSFKSAVPIVSPTGQTLSSGSPGMQDATPVVYNPQTQNSYQSSPSQPAPAYTPQTPYTSYSPQTSYMQQTPYTPQTSYSPFYSSFAGSYYSPFANNYNPYFSFQGSGYNPMFTPNYYNNMAYQMARLPSYNIPFAGNYYNYSSPTSQFSGTGFNTPYSTMSGYTPGTTAYSQNLPYYMPGVGMGTYDDWF